jgi:hypothetical protein
MKRETVRRFQVVESPRKAHTCNVCGATIAAGEPHKSYKHGENKSRACSTCDIGRRADAGAVFGGQRV